MNQQNTFSYSYSAQENQEVLNIRKKYLPREETQLEELKRLDQTVQNSGIVAALTLGIGSCLVFGMGMCFGLGVLGSVIWPCVPLGLIGAVGMLLFMMVSMITPLGSTAVHVVLCLTGGILFAIGLGTGSNRILKKTSLV